MSKILVIDDDASFREAVSKALTQQGLEVVNASDGREGLAAASETQPDLIVCDLNMPVMDGYEVLAALRGDPRLTDIPVIFLTGQSAPGQVRQGMDLGADDYLTKPANLADVLSAITARLSRREALRQRQEKQMTRAMGLFASIVHDLRDPLFVLLGYAGLLEGGTGGVPRVPEPSRQILDRMQQAMLRMQTIIAETLFLARSRMQHLPFDPGPFDLREFCQQLLAEAALAPRLRFESAPGPFPIVADALRLRQALENLISNALKYAAGLVTVRLTAGSEKYLLEVSDQGIGIPRAEQAGVFEPFFRASNTAGKPGHGLGLSIVKTCIEQHGGSVHFSSVDQQGTTFFIELPKTPPANATLVARILEPVAELRRGEDGARPMANVKAGRAEGGSPRPRDLGRLKAIIVDDDLLVRGLLRDLLEPSLLILGEAGSVADARRLAKQHKLDVVFLDVNLPDASGFDLLPDLSPNVSVVFVTSAEEYAAHAFDCEAADFLLKPVSPERLEQALDRVRQRLAANSTRPVPGPGTRDSFLVKSLTERRVIKIGDIQTILACGEYSWVHWAGEKKGTLIRKSLKQWLAELPTAQFIRVHRGAIVNLGHLERIENLRGGRLRVHLRGSAEPVLVSLRLGPALNRKLKTLRG